MRHRRLDLSRSFGWSTSWHFGVELRTRRARFIYAFKDQKTILEALKISRTVKGIFKVSDLRALIMTFCWKIGQSGWWVCGTSKDPCFLVWNAKSVVLVVISIEKLPQGQWGDITAFKRIAYTRPRAEIIRVGIENIVAGTRLNCGNKICAVFIPAAIVERTAVSHVGEVSETRAPEQGSLILVTCFCRAVIALVAENAIFLSWRTRDYISNAVTIANLQRPRRVKTW